MSVLPIIGFSVLITASALIFPLVACNDSNGPWTKFGAFVLSLLTGVWANYFFIQLLMRSGQ
jgi:hypothetical protein